MSKSKYIRTIRWRLPRHRRSVRLPGAEEDRGRFWKCWNCGFLIDTKRGLGGSEGSGVRYSDVPNPTMTNILPGLNGALLSRWFSPFEVGLLPRNGPDGTPSTFIQGILEQTQVLPEALQGCPLCGTTNLP